MDVWRVGWHPKADTVAGDAVAKVEREMHVTAKLMLPILCGAANGSLCFLSRYLAPMSGHRTPNKAKQGSRATILEPPVLRTP